MKTPPDPAPSTDPILTPKAAVPLKKDRRLPSGCLPTVFAVFILFAFVEMMIPCFACIGGKGSQTKALAQAKGIGLALKLFASDHDGNYPRAGVPVEVTAAPRNSNQAFACVFPFYCQSETLFGNKLSAYQTGKGPDNRIDNPFVWPPVETLRPGENVYGYMMGLTEDSSPSTPLVIDGTDGSRHYNKAEHLRGSTWKEGKVVVIRVDNSGSLERLPGPDNTLYLPRLDDRQKNALDVDYLGKTVRYLDPAIVGP